MVINAEWFEGVIGESLCGGGAMLDEVKHEALNAVQPQLDWKEWKW